ncbi:hypothetical protein D3C79_263070 [compost metagenome]
MLIAMLHIDMHEGVRIDTCLPAGALQSLTATQGGKMVFWQMQAEWLTMTCREQSLHRLELTLFVVRNVAGDRIVQTFTVGQHAREGEQFGRQWHLTQPHGGVDDAVRPV